MNVSELLDRHDDDEKLVSLLTTIAIQAEPKRATALQRSRTAANLRSIVGTMQVSTLCANAQVDAEVQDANLGSDFAAKATAVFVQKLNTQYLSLLDDDAAQPLNEDVSTGALS